MRNDVFTRIEQDHVQVKGHLQQIAMIADAAWQKREEPFHRLRNELMVHFRAEDAVVYSLIVREDEFRRDGLEAEEQHHLIEFLLSELDQLPKNDPRWAIKFSLMRDLFGRHVDYEGDRVFDDARELVSRQEADTLTDRYTDEKQRIAADIEMTVTIP